MAVNAGNYVLVHRKIVHWALYKDPNCVVVFLNLLVTASWKGGRVKYRGEWIDLQPGDLAISIRELSERVGLSEKQVHRVLELLKQEGTLRANSRANKFHVISICNWSSYQFSPENASKTLSEKEGKQEGKQIEEGINKVQEGYNKKSVSLSEKPTGLSPLFVCRDVQEAYLDAGEIATIQMSLQDKAGKAIAEYAAETRKKGHPVRPYRANLTKLIIKYGSGLSRNGAPVPKGMRPDAADLWEADKRAKGEWRE